MTSHDLFWSLLEARTWLRENYRDGVRCPCCDQYAKIYSRKLNSTQARLLIALVRNWQAEPRWFSVREGWYLSIARATGDMGKLACWGLVEEKMKDSADKEQQEGGKTSGFWRPTPKGVLFADNRLRVPERVEIYNAQVVGFAGEPASIVECLGERFDYQELMST